MIVTLVVVMGVVLLARVGRAAVAAWLDPTALLTPEPVLADAARGPTRRDAR